MPCCSAFCPVNHRRRCATSTVWRPVVVVWLCACRHNRCRSSFVNSHMRLLHTLEYISATSTRVERRHIIRNHTHECRAHVLICVTHSTQRKTLMRCSFVALEPQRWRLDCETLSVRSNREEHAAHKRRNDLLMGLYRLFRFAYGGDL